MNHRWCEICCTMHTRTERCPGELRVNVPERHGWRVNVETPHGIEAYGVLIGRTDGGAWRARVLTYPNILWAIPGGSGTMKWVADNPVTAERLAIEYVLDHCRRRGLRLRDEVSKPEARRIVEAEGDFVVPSPALRVIRFLPVRFGVIRPAEIGGTANLSETGLFVITHHPLETDTQVRLSLDLAETELTLTGDVRWMNELPRLGRSPGMGIRLQSPPDKYAEYVRTLALPPVTAQG